MAKIIILIGKTGSGKSTLANVISGTNEFIESGSSASVTKEIKKGKAFSYSDVSYVVIDTVGIGDTQLKREEVLDKIAEAVYLAREGISQVLFITNGRFDQFEMSIYSLLSTIIFDKSVTNYTTIVRTKFPEFDKEKELQKDIEGMMSSKGELSNIIKTCRQRVIHIDNPSLDIEAADDESDGEREEREELIDLRKKIRNKSQKKVLEHLRKICLEQKEEYKPQKLQELSAEVAECIEESINKRKELAEKKIKLGLEVEKKKKNEEVNKKISISKSNKNESEKVSAEVTEGNQTELAVETIEEQKKDQEKFSADVVDNNQDQKSDKKMIVKIRITDLENELKELTETKKLIKVIHETEAIIRRRVLNHIFNNIKDINQVVGGDVFLNSIVSDDDNPYTSKLSIAELQKQREKLEKKLSEQGNNNQSLEEIETEIKQKEQKLLDLKLLNDKEIAEEWQKQGFGVREAEEWTEILGSSFDPEVDINFCVWLRDNEKIPNKGELSNEEIEKLRSEHQRFREKKWQEDNKKWQEWQEDLKHLTGQEVIERFNQQKSRKLQWISYEEFTNIEYLAQGGFSKIYRAKWNNKNIVLKFLNNSQKITLDFLTEIANNKLVDDNLCIIRCYGISQDPKTKNYVMIMEYMKEGNLRQFLQNNVSSLNLDDKLHYLLNIAWGLRYIHHQNLIHRDLHSGNTLSENINPFPPKRGDIYITDLGLNQPVNYQKKEDQIFGVLPYVAPEILQGKSYTQASDVYSFGIIAYELFANAYPYSELENLDLKICLGLRPDINKLKIPQLLKDLIKRCWDSKAENRPTAKELYDITNDWYWKIKVKENIPFYQQYQALAEQYNTFSQKTPYQIHARAVTTSKPINTKQITQQLAAISQGIGQVEIPDLSELTTQDPPAEISYQTQIEIPPKQN